VAATATVVVTATATAAATATVVAMAAAGAMVVTAASTQPNHSTNKKLAALALPVFLCPPNSVVPAVSFAACSPS
jgi:hypothetical protein